MRRRRPRSYSLMHKMRVTLPLHRPFCTMRNKLPAALQRHTLRRPRQPTAAKICVCVGRRRLKTCRSWSLGCQGASRARARARPGPKNPRNLLLTKSRARPRQPRLCKRVQSRRPLPTNPSPLLWAHIARAILRSTAPLARPAHQLAKDRFGHQPCARVRTPSALLLQAAAAYAHYLPHPPRLKHLWPVRCPRARPKATPSKLTQAGGTLRRRTLESLSS